MSFPGKSCNTKSLNHTSISLSFGDADDINHFIFFEYLVYFNIVFHEFFNKVDLGFGISSTINLNLHNVCLFLPQIQLTRLCMTNCSHNLAVSDNSIILGFNLILFIPLWNVLWEALLLRLVPVLVEISLGFFVDVLCPNSCQNSEPSWGFNVSNHSYHLHWWSFDDSYCFVYFLVVELWLGPLDKSLDMGHSSFESHESSKVGRFTGIISWEWTDLSSVLSCALPRKKSKWTMTRHTEFSVWHVCEGISFANF